MCNTENRVGDTKLSASFSGTRIRPLEIYHGQNDAFLIQKAIGDYLELIVLGSVWLIETASLGNFPSESGVVWKQTNKAEPRECAGVENAN